MHVVVDCFLEAVFRAVEYSHGGRSVPQHFSQRLPILGRTLDTGAAVQFGVLSAEASTQIPNSPEPWRGQI